MCLDSSSQSQANAFKLVFDQQSNSKVRGHNQSLGRGMEVIEELHLLAKSGYNIVSFRLGQSHQARYGPGGCQVGRTIELVAHSARNNKNVFPLF